MWWFKIFDHVFQFFFLSKYISAHCVESGHIVPRMPFFFGGGGLSIYLLCGDLRKWLKLLPAENPF